jgi:hypothetical protein
VKSPRAFVLLFVAGCVAPAKDEGPVALRGPAVMLTKAALGTPIVGSPTVTAVIDSAGGSLTSPDGRATLTVAPDVLSAPVEFSVQEITDTAPGGVGNAYRFGPIDAPLPEVALSFAPDTATSVADLTLASQGGDSYWIRLRNVQRDLGAGTLSVAAGYVGDWAVVAANTAADLSGVFTLTSAKGIPFVATGQATLNYGGDDAQGSHYLQWGTFTLQDPIGIGTATCTASPRDWQLYPNVADLSIALGRFDWGISGVWHLGCDDGTSTDLTTAFDTFGVNDIGCSRGWVQTPILTLTQVTGTYRVECGAGEIATVDLDFRN